MYATLSELVADSAVLSDSRRLEETTPEIHQRRLEAQSRRRHLGISMEMDIGTAMNGGILSSASSLMPSVTTIINTVTTVTEYVTPDWVTNIRTDLQNAYNDVNDLKTMIINQVALQFRPFAQMSGSEIATISFG